MVCSDICNVKYSIFIFFMSMMGILIRLVLKVSSAFVSVCHDLEYHRPFLLFCDLNFLLILNFTNDQKMTKILQNFESVGDKFIRVHPGELGGTKFILVHPGEPGGKKSSGFTRVNLEEHSSSSFTRVNPEDKNHQRHNFGISEASEYVNFT